MALPYRRITAEEDQMRNVLEKGEYSFWVKSIKQGKTEKGDHEMLTVELGILNDMGREITIKDWIVFMDEMGWKLRHFAATCGLLDRYDDETLDTKDFLGKNGIVKLKIADYEKDGEARKVNRVVDYIKPSQTKESQAKSPANDFIDDELSF